MALIAMIFMIVGLMIGDDRPPRYQIQGSADRSIYLPGDTITFSWDFELLRDCWGWTTRRLILPNRVVNLPERIWDYQHIPNRELPRFMTFSIGVFLPIENVEAGTGYYDITGHYVCNPLQNLWPITVDFPVIPFLITTNN